MSEQAEVPSQAEGNQASEFVFDAAPRKKKTDSQRRKQTRERVARWRAKQAARPSALERRWNGALAALPEADSQAIQALAQRREALMTDILGVIAGKAERPDLVCADVDHWRQEHPLIDFPTDCIRNDRATDFPVEESDDQYFRDYGIRVHITKHLYRVFVEIVDRWCREHSEDADAEVAAKVHRLSVEWNPPREIASTPKFIPERDRAELIRARQMAEDEREKIQHDLAVWQERQLGGSNQFGS
jgi:hypothetical protein